MLLLLSVASWYLIVTRAQANWLAGRRAEAFLACFWQARSLADVSGLPHENAFAALVHHATEAMAEAQRQGEASLAVEIPAVLAYNAFNRRNRMWLAKLESFAHDLYVLLTVKNGHGR